MPTISNQKLLLSGLFYIAIGIFFVAGSRGLDFGSGSNLGPGVFPTIIGYSLAVVGVLSVITSVRAPAETLGHQPLWPLALVVGAILAFALLIEPAGLMVATLAAVVIASAQRLRTHWIEVVLTAAVLSGFVAIVFVQLLGVRIPIWPSFL